MQKQCERVLDYLHTNGSITQNQAFNDIGVMRLASRISDLRRNGYAISKKMVKSRNRYGEIISFARYCMDDQEATQ